MPKPRERKQPGRKRKAVNDNNARSDRTIEFKLVEPVQPAPVTPKLWRDNLKRLAADFLSTRKQHGRLKCTLFQKSDKSTDPQEPPYDMELGQVSGQTAIYEYFEEYAGTDAKPIYDSQGRGGMIVTSTVRHWTYCGTTGAGKEFVELAKRAGRALFSSPERTIDWIPRGTRFSRSDEDRWVWSVFDLAWQGRHPSLRAKRQTWFRPAKPITGVKSNLVYLPYDLQQLRYLRECGPTSLLSFPEGWTERLPGYFISELPDLLQASVDLIDVLLDTAAQTEGDVSQSRSSSEAAESSTHGTAPDTGGRPAVSKPDARKRQDLVDRWNRAKAKGVRQKDFCRDDNVSLGHLTKCIDWRRQRRRRRNQS